MKNTRAWQTKIDEMQTQVRSIVEAATKQDRELTDAEQATIDRINGTGRQAGELALAIEAKERCARIETQELNDVLAKQRPNLGDRQPTAGWQADGHGAKYAVLSQSQKVADLFDQQPENAFSHYVLAKTFGVSKKWTPDSVRTAMSSGDNTAGGYLVPDELSGQIIDLARAQSVVMASGATTVTMSSESITIPILSSDPTFVGSKTQNSTFTASDFAFKAARLQAHTTGTLVKISRELWEDAGDMLASQLTQFLVRKMAERMDYWCLSGSGSQQPLGILNSSGI